MTSADSISERRIAALRAVLSTLRHHEAACRNDRDIEYPISVPDLDEHLDLLLELAGESRGTPSVRNSVRLQARLCTGCPHQFPQRYCPLRWRDGCTAFRHAQEIVFSVKKAVSNEHVGRKEPHHASQTA